MTAKKVKLLQRKLAKIRRSIKATKRLLSNYETQETEIVGRLYIQWLGEK
jgi:hypothetical protein